MSVERRELEIRADRIEAVLDRHNLEAYVTGGLVTSRLVRFHLKMPLGGKVKQVASLHEEIAMALDCREVRIRREGGQIDIEMSRNNGGTVRLADLHRELDNIPSFTAILGVDGTGIPLLLRLISADVTHVLIAGTTGSGKTALARGLLTSLAAGNEPESLRILLIDPKRRGFAPLASLPHVLRGTISDQGDIHDALAAVLQEMEERDHSDRNRPIVVVAIDELADLIQTGGKGVERAITRLTQRGREAGIHVVACTQKPSAALIGSGMKANFPVRLVGSVASKDEARYATGIADSGAEKLEGRGDFLLIARGDAIRFQASWVEEADVVSLAGEPPARSYELLTA